MLTIVAIGVIMVYVKVAYKYRHFCMSCLFTITNDWLLFISRDYF